MELNFFPFCSLPKGANHDQEARSELGPIEIKSDRVSPVLATFHTIFHSPHK